MACLVTAAAYLVYWIVSSLLPKEHVSIVPSPLNQDASRFTQALVLAKTREEDTDWLFHGGFNE